MNIKEKSMQLLLTTTMTYREIAAKVVKTTPNAKTTDKCIAYYAMELRKADKTCLDHRKTSRTSSTTTADLIKKYKKS